MLRDNRVICLQRNYASITMTTRILWKPFHNFAAAQNTQLHDASKYENRRQVGAASRPWSPPLCSTSRACTMISNKAKRDYKPVTLHTDSEAQKSFTKSSVRGFFMCRNAICFWKIVLKCSYFPLRSSRSLTCTQTNSVFLARPFSILYLYHLDKIFSWSPEVLMIYSSSSKYFKLH